MKRNPTVAMWSYHVVFMIILILTFVMNLATTGAAARSSSSVAHFTTAEEALLQQFRTYLGHPNIFLKYTKLCNHAIMVVENEEPARLALKLEHKTAQMVKRRCIELKLLCGKGIKGPKEGSEKWRRTHHQRKQEL